MVTPVWTVRSLVDRTFSLLREHPIFALPVIAADFLSFAAMHIQHALHQPLFTWVFSNSNSVLATTRSPFVLTSENASKAALLVIPLVWGCYFLSVFLYTGALLITSALVRRISDSESPDLRAALAYTVRSWRRLLLFSISMLGALIIVAIVFGILVMMSMKIAWLAPRIGRDFSYLIVLPLEIALVYLFTSPALKLIAEIKTSLSLRTLRMAIYFGLITIITQMVFVLVLDHIAPISLFQQKTVTGFLICEAIVSLIGASPYIPLFIGLSVLADSDKQLDSVTGLEEVEGSIGDLPAK
jgi:hypothetical protein